VDAGPNGTRYGTHSQKTIRSRGTGYSICRRIAREDDLLLRCFGDNQLNVAAVLHSLLAYKSTQKADDLSGIIQTNCSVLPIRQGRSLFRELRELSSIQIYFPLFCIRARGMLCRK
jgi:hypothetical protein